MWVAGGGGGGTTPASLNAYSINLEGVTGIGDSASWVSNINFDGNTANFNEGSFTKVSETSVDKVVIPRSGFFNVKANVRFITEAGTTGNRRGHVELRMVRERSGVANVIAAGHPTAYIRGQYVGFSDGTAVFNDSLELEDGDKIYFQSLVRTQGGATFEINGARF